jgi:hypothetical protein
MERQDWINFGAMAPPIGVLFGFAFGLFEGPPMTPLCEGLWIGAALAIAGFTWRGTSALCWGARMADMENKRRLNDMSNEIVKLLTNEDMFDKLVRIVKSKQSAAEKIENVRSLVNVRGAFEDVGKVSDSTSVQIDKAKKPDEK